MTTPITIRYAYFENADCPVPCSPLIRVADTKEVVFDPSRMKPEALKTDLSKISNFKKGTDVYLDLISILALKPNTGYQFGFKSAKPPDCWAHTVFVISKDTEDMGIVRRVGWPGSANSKAYGVPLPRDADVVAVEHAIDSETDHQKNDNF